MMKSAKKTKKKIGLKLVLIGVFCIFLVFSIVLTLVAEKIEDDFNLRWDLTVNQTYTIGDTTKTILYELDKKIIIYTLYQTGEEDLTVSELLSRYEAESDFIEIKNIDPVELPLFVDEYEEIVGEEITEGSIIVQEKDSDNFRVIYPQDLYEWELDEDQLYATGMVAEMRITSAINSIEGGAQTNAYFITGHGEMDETEQYYLASTLESDGYNVETYDLIYNSSDLKEEDCLLFLSPTVDLTEEEYEIVSEFMEQGGCAVFLINPVAGDLENFNKIFAEFGIDLVDDFVIESDESYYFSSQVALSPILNDENTINQSIIEAGVGVILPRCRSITYKESEDIVINPLFWSSDQSYAKVDSQTSTTEKENGDTEGPFVLGVSAEDTSSGAKLVLIGSSDFVATLDNAKYQGNITLFMESVSWASGSGDSIVIASKSLVAAPLLIASNSSAVSLAIGLIVVIPIIIFGVGVIVWFRRRKY